MNIKLALERAECRLTPDEFGKFLIDLLAIIHPGWTSDELLVHPREALAFCDSVRYREPPIVAGSTPDDVILRSMLRFRKAGKKKTKPAA